MISIRLHASPSPVIRKLIVLKFSNETIFNVNCTEMSETIEIARLHFGKNTNFLLHIENLTSFNTNILWKSCFGHEKQPWTQKDHRNTNDSGKDQNFDYFYHYYNLGYIWDILSFSSWNHQRKVHNFIYHLVFHGRHDISKSELPLSAFCEYQLFIEVYTV